MVNVHIVKVIELIKMKKITILLLLILCSCGTRKTDTTQNENIIIENQYNTGSKIVLGNTFTYKPFDVLKPMVIQGKEYKNVIISNDKTIIKEKWNNRYITKTIIIEKTKQTTKNNNWIFIVLIVCGFVFLYFYLPKLKTGI